MRIAVIQGGPSSEAEVSRTSAAGVAKALLEAGHHVTQLELSRGLSAALHSETFDVAFPVVHGALGEDGCLQGLLEVMAIPYVGSNVLASAMAMDKPTAKKLFRAANLPVAEEALVSRGEDPLAAARRVRELIGKAIVVKPGAQGSAIGVALISREAPDSEVAAALTKTFEFDDVALCERFVVGLEVTCGVTDVLSLGGLTALPPTEIHAKLAGFYDFASRYAAGGSDHTCPANLPIEVITRIQSIAIAAHVTLGCRDLSRVDFVVGDGDDKDAVTLLEVNTLPGMTATSLYPEAMGKRGVDFVRMCDAFVHAAKARGERRVVPVLAMP